MTYQGDVTEWVGRKPKGFSARNTTQADQIKFLRYNNQQDQSFPYGYNLELCAPWRTNSNAWTKYANDSAGRR